jgi:hypothetical protein
MKALNGLDDKMELASIVDKIRYVSILCTRRQPGSGSEAAVFT